MTLLDGRCTDHGPAPLAPGAEVAPGYPVLRHVRRGEDVDSYEVWSTTRYSRCLARTPRPDRADDAEVRRALVREGGLLLAASHPHLVRAYALHAPRDGVPALVLEALPGPTLEDLMAEHGRLPVRVVGLLAAHLCSAARYLHDRGHLHLDVTPGTVVVSGGLARLVHLGLSRAPGVGTVRNVAPEQARGDAVSAATDAWGIGLLLYEAATGHRPFGDRTCRCGDAGCDVHGPRHRRPEGRAPRVRAHRSLPAEAAAAIDACLAPDPVDRPSLEALDAALAGLITGDEE